MRSPRYLVPLSDLRPYIEPLGNRIWDRDDIRLDDILTSVRENRLQPMPWNTFNNTYEGLGEALGETARSFHVERIAYFVKNGVPNDYPIYLGFDNVNNGIRVLEGRHRIAAAFIRNEKTVEAAFLDDGLTRLLPNCELLPDPNVSNPALRKKFPSVDQ